MTLLLAAPAAAQTTTTAYLSFSDGRPVLDGNGVRWRVCPPDAGCFTPYRTTNLFELSFDPAPAGTRVDALVGEAVVRTAVWHGTPVAVTPPALTGSVVTGGEVAVTPGAWSGGWGDSIDQPGAIACPAPDSTGDGCRTLRPRLGRPANTFIVPGELAGWYARGTSALLSQDMATRVARRFSRLRPSRAFSEPVQIALAPPVVELRRRASRSSLGYGFGRVRCFAPQCAVTIEVTGKRNATHTFTAKRLQSLLVPKEKRLRPGLYKVRVTVDGTARADGYVRLVRFG
jgi:hypothetical protein